jgi:hypothetical protein
MCHCRNMCATYPTGEAVSKSPGPIAAVERERALEGALDHAAKRDQSGAERIFTPLVRWGIYTLLDDAMLKSFGFPRPFAFVRKLVHGTLKMRGRVVRILPARKT